MPSNEQWGSERGHPAAFWERPVHALYILTRVPLALTLFLKKNQLLFKISMQGIPVQLMDGFSAFPAGTWVQSLVGELDPRKLHGRVKNKTKQKPA